jgi:hypothetical protein
MAEQDRRGWGKRWMEWRQQAGGQASSEAVAPGLGRGRATKGQRVTR